MNKIILKIGGMSCSACKNRLEKYLNKQNGIKNASVNLVLNQAIIEYDQTLTKKDLEKFVAEAGYQSLGVYKSIKEEESKYTKLLLIIYGFLALLIMYISMSPMFKLPIFSFLTNSKSIGLTLLILTIPFLIYGLSIFKNGFKTLFHLSPNMDTLVTIGVLSSFIYSLYNLTLLFKDIPVHLYFESSAIVIYFIKFGRYISKKSLAQAKKALEKLVTITPDYAILKINDTEKQVTIDEVKKGDILICKPGDKIAVDGKIIKGETYIDEAFLTGEAKPSKKGIDDLVMAGSININGYIEYEALHIGQESTISEIVRLVLEATTTKARIATIADKVSSYFVPGVIILSILTLIGYLILGHPLNVALTHFVNVLVVSCPCALGLATPLALVVSLGLCANNGLLIKSSEVLENVNNIDTIVFDKTGTLTYGNLHISKIYNYSQLSNEEILNIICSVEQNSNHPIAKAFQNYAKSHHLKLSSPSNFTSLNGLGLQATLNNKEILLGNSKLFTKLKLENPHLSDEETLTKAENSLVYLFINNKLISLIGLKDIIRPTTKKALNNLKALNKQIIMLTGDNEQTANSIAKDLPITKVYADVLPKAKSDIIRSLLDNEKKVMMVGDGINDAPSLALSSVAVSIESATDIAMDTADVIIINNNLDLLSTLFKISKKTITIIKENLFWAFFYNILMIPIAMGLFEFINISINPMLASLSMMLSSITVILNSLRIKIRKEEK